jgi:hypothetical protein
VINNTNPNSTTLSNTFTSFINVQGGQGKKSFGGGSGGRVVIDLVLPTKMTNNPILHGGVSRDTSLQEYYNGAPGTLFYY